MEPYHENTDIILGVEITKDGIIEIHIGGDMTEKHKESILEWTNHVTEALQEAKQSNPSRVLTLVDITKLGRYDAECVEIFQKLMAKDKGIATKTAIYGGGTVEHVTIELMIGLTSRYNMKLFDTRDAALEWLCDDAQRPEISDTDPL